MKKIIFCLTALLLILPVAYALTASIGNGRMVIHTEIEEGETAVIEKYVRVNNVNDVPVQITLEPRGDLVDIIEIMDESFTLEPGESKDAQFIIELEYGGTYEGQIGVAFSPVEGGHGVGLSSTVIIIAEGPEDPNREEVPEDEDIDEEEDEEIFEEDIYDEEEEGGVSVTGGKTPPKEDKDDTLKDRKANPLVGILVILVIVGVGVIITLAVMMFLRKK